MKNSHILNKEFSEILKINIYFSLLLYELRLNITY